MNLISKHLRLTASIIIFGFTYLSTAHADGLSVSTKSTMTKGGNFTSSGYIYDANFKLRTNGKVGRNGQRGNVKSAMINGINTTLKPGVGTLTLKSNVKNEPNLTHIEHIGKLGDVPEKTISMSTGTPANFKQLPNINGRFVVTGIWMNSNAFCMNCNFSFTTGMFMDGEVATIGPSDTNDESSKEFSTFTGVLDGMPQGECDGECDWGLKATLSADMSIVDHSVTIKTSDSFIHYTKADSGKTRIEARPDLNMTGVLTYDEKRQLFEGKIKDGRGVSGKAMGRYFGPNREEIAIVYSLGNASPETMQMGVIFGSK